METMDGTAAIEGDDFVDELKPGTVLMRGQYTIERFLNSGGFGITYLARDSLARKIVIKECFPGAFARRTNLLVKARSRAHQGEYSAVVRHFVQEAHSLAKLKHPNIVGVHQVFEENETAYMALDFVEGRDLLDTLEDPNHGLSPHDIKNMLKEVLGAVEYMHGENVLHRDISPDNILIDQNRSPVLIDFGAARENKSEVGRALSALRVVKEGYSPHEFYLSGSTQSESSDLYALAASFYHLICGEVPPDSQTRLAAIAAKSPDPYVMLSTRATEYGLAFTSAIDHALRVLPKNRLQSARAWLDKLNEPIIVLENDADSEGVADPLHGLEPDAETVIDRSIFDTGPVRPQLSELMEPENIKSVFSKLVAKTLAVVSRGQGISNVWKIRGAVTAIAVFGIIYVAQVGDVQSKWSDASSVPFGSQEQHVELLAAPAEIANPVRSEIDDIKSVDVSQKTTDTSLGLVPATAPAPIARPSQHADQNLMLTEDPSLSSQEATIFQHMPAELKIASKTKSVVLPFQNSGMFIEAGSSDSVFRDGQSIVSINGRKILSDRDVAISLNGLAAGVEEDVVEVRFEIRDPSQKKIFEDVRMLPVADEYALSNGLVIQTAKLNSKWVTYVVETPEGNDIGDLMIDDVIIADLASGETISERDTFIRVVRGGLEKGAQTFRFAIQRGRSMQIATLTKL